MFEEGTVVTPEILLEAGVIKKVLERHELRKKINSLIGESV